MKLSIDAILVQALLTFALQPTAFAAPGSCGTLQQQHDAVQSQVEDACDRDDRASQRQCNVLKQKLVRLGDALTQAGCAGGGDDDEGDEGEEE